MSASQQAQPQPQAPGAAAPATGAAPAKGAAAAGEAAEPPKLGDVVSAATFVVAIITAWLYVAGWAYAYHYFDRFRIPLLMAELPKEHYFVYGGLVVWKNLAWATALAVLAIAFAWLCTLLARRLGRFWASAALVLAVVGLFALARVGGIRSALDDFLAQRDSDYAAYPRISLTLKKDTAAEIKAGLADLPTTDCGRLVLFSGGRLFLIRPIRGAAGADLDSFVVPLDRLEAFRIRGEYASCS